jgi:hypothetical protein
MVHRNAPLSIEGRRRPIERCRTRPIAHVAAEMDISRASASKWVNRCRQHGDFGLLDRPSAPYRQPSATGADVIQRIGDLRRTNKWPAARIAFELQQVGSSPRERCDDVWGAAVDRDRREYGGTSHGQHDERDRGHGSCR